MAGKVITAAVRSNLAAREVCATLAVFTAIRSNLTAWDVWATLTGFTAIYLFLAVLAVFAAVRFINRTRISEEA